MSTNTSTQLTTTRADTSLLPAPDAWSTMSQMSAVLADSGLMPDSLKGNRAAILTIMLKGRELGLPAMTAINGINVIKGKPTVTAETMAALIYRDHGDDSLQWLEATDERATVSYRRRTATQRQEYSFSIKDAERAGYPSTNPNWKKIPGNMLRARCISNVARMAFPDSIGGMYSEEEMEDMQAQDGATPTVVDVTPSGRTINTATGEVIDDPTMTGVYDHLWRDFNAATTQDDLLAAWNALKAARKAGQITADEAATLTALKDTVKAALAAPQVIEAQAAPPVVPYNELERRVGLVFNEDGAHEVRQDVLTARDAGPDAGGITPEQYATLDKHIDERLTVALPF